MNVNFFIKYEINHDLVASILLYYIANIYKICLIIVSYICIAIDITLLYTMIIKYTKEESIMGQNKKSNKNGKVFEISEHYSKRVPKSNTQNPHQKPIDIEYMTGGKKGGKEK